MRVAVIGTGYVGLVTGACLASAGHTVCCVDTDEARVHALKNGEVPFYEPGLSEMVQQCADRQNIYFYTRTAEAISNCDVCFIAVGTPQTENGHAELQYVEQASRDIGRSVEGDILIVTKSTVPVGTSEKVKAWVMEELSAREFYPKVTFASNPEFLKEGVAVNDFMHPDRIVIGCDDADSIEILRELYATFNQKRDRIIVMDVRSAELTKYASNAMLASRISFMNEMALICEKVGANITQIRLGMGMDERIGSSFLYAGCGFGGSCFPKDVSALISTAKENGADTRLLDAVLGVNTDQKEILFKKISEHFNGYIKGRTFAVWGLSFKPNTDDIREAPALVLIEALTEQGAKVVACDPKAGDNAKKYFEGNNKVSIVANAYDTLKQADALVHVTEWAEFRNPDLKKLGSLLKNKIVFDGRNVYNRKTFEKHGFVLYQIGM